MTSRRPGRWGDAPLHPALPALSLGYAVLAIVADWLDPDAGRPSTILMSGLFVFGLIYYAARLKDRSRDWVVGGAAAAAEAATVIPSAPASLPSSGAAG